MGLQRLPQWAQLVPESSNESDKLLGFGPAAESQYIQETLIKLNEFDVFRLNDSLNELNELQNRQMN